MSYLLRFHELALEEWRSLPLQYREQFKKKLAERLKNPHIASAKLYGMKDCYKIKLQKAGLRLVYRVEDNIVTVTVVSVGKREKLQAYKKAAGRL